MLVGTKWRLPQGRAKTAKLYAADRMMTMKQPSRAEGDDAVSGLKGGASSEVGGNSQSRLLGTGSL